MNKTLKTGLIIVGALAALFVAAAVILAVTFDPNDYKEEIAKAAKEATGRDLVFEGDISLNFFPWLGLEVGPVALANAEGFAPKEMVRVNKAMASIRVLPLLAGDVMIGQVVLDGFTLNLAVDKQGKSNWADLSGEKAKDDAPEASASPGEEGAAKGSAPESLSVEGVKITGAQVNYVDAQTGQKASVTDLNLTVGQVGDRLTTPFELTFGLKLNDKIETKPTLTGFATFDQAKGTLELGDLALALLNMRWTGFFYAKSADDKLNYSGEFKLTRMSPKELMTQLGAAAPVTADPKALTRAEADIKVNGTGNSVSLEELTVKLDDTTLKGTGSVKNFARPAITVQADVDDLDVDRYLAPKGEGGAAKAEPAAKTEDAAAPAQEPDLSALRDLDLTAKLTMGKVKAMNLRVTDILLEARAKDGVLTVSPFKASLYEGGLTGHSVLDATGKLAAWKEQAELKNVQAGPLLKDLTGKDHVLGTAVAKYDVTGAGLTPDNIKKTLTGTASFAFTDGAISGVNVAKMLRDAWSRLKGKPVSGDEPEKTDFAELLGSAVMDKGHVTNNDLLMKSPLLRLTGKGWADLPKNEVDYLATVTVVGTLKGQDGASMEELTGLPLPLRVKGALDDPEIGLDPKALAEALFKGTFKKGTKDLEKNLKDSILGGSKPGTKTDGDQKKGPGSLLKGLFNQ
jgi:AsmA protein